MKTLLCLAPMLQFTSSIQLMTSDRFWIRTYVSLQKNVNKKTGGHENYENYL